MSKVICEVCGTMYPDTAAQCPICGSVRSADSNTVPENASQGNKARTPVKGGRFSKSNVRKRNRSEQNQPEVSAAEEKPKKKMDKVDKGLVVLLVVLLLAIACVAVYIGSRFLVMGGGAGTGKPSTAATTDPSNGPTQTTGQIQRPCTGLTLSVQQISFTKTGATQTLKVTTSPADTTDTVTFHSSDERIASVDGQGKVTAVGSGEAKITVTCGEKQVQCTVVCEFKQQTTEPSAETTKPTEEETTDEDFYLTPEDITFFYEGESYTFTTGVKEPEKITWTSDDPDVVTVKGGTVTAVDGGTATITAKYKGKTASCIIRCNFERTHDSNIGSENESSGGNAGGNNQAPAYIISHIDVTLSAGESFVLQLADTSGNAQNVTWSSSNSAVCSVSGNVVTGTGSGTANVSCTYEGAQYICIVRVK